MLSWLRKLMRHSFVMDLDIDTALTQTTEEALDEMGDKKQNKRCRMESKHEESRAKRSKLDKPKQIPFQMPGAFSVFGWAPKPYETDMLYGFLIDGHDGRIRKFNNQWRTSSNDRVIVDQETKCHFPGTVLVKNNKTNLHLAETIKSLRS